MKTKTRGRQAWKLAPDQIRSDEIRRLRKERKLSQNALADAVDVTRMMIYLAEKGESLSPRLAKLLARYFRVPVSQIIIGQEDISLVESVKID